jgi:hypothetical protein
VPVSQEVNIDDLELRKTNIPNPETPIANRHRKSNRVYPQLNAEESLDTELGHGTDGAGSVDD